MPNKELRKKMLREYITSDERKQIERDLARLRRSNWVRPIKSLILVLTTLAIIAITIYIAL